MDILREIDDFYRTFKSDAFNGKGVFGYSEEGRPLFYFNVCRTEKPKVILQYCIHAREYITSYLALKHIEDYVKNAVLGNVLFLPCVNPDGVKRVTDGDVLYKANARGVDLNVNFDADWGKGEKNVFFPSKENYVGKYPFSEAETRAIRDITLSFLPDVTISYHSKGREIYYGYKDKFSEKEKRYAEELAYLTGYKVKRLYNSCGGYKDWCALRLNIPAVTIEVGRDGLSHPIGVENLDEIYYENKAVIERTVDFFSR